MSEVNQYLTKKSYVDTELAKKLENDNGTIEAIDSRVVFSKDQNDIAIDYINKEEVRLSDSSTNTKALLSPSGLTFIDSNNNYKTISNITNDFSQQSQTLALSQKGAYDLAATKQDVLTPGANITIAEDQQTGDLVISSTGGGTSVIANPLDQSSADLVKIKIDNVTYDIPGGGGQTYNDFTGATASTAGTHGLVPAPLAGDQNKYLKADGTWAEVAGGGGASTIVEESVQIAGGAPAYQCTHTISDYDMIGFVYEGAAEIHWTAIDKTASKDCYIGDISNVNAANQYALTEGKIVVDAINNTVENEYSTMFHYIGSSYQNTYDNRRIVKLYFAKISGGGESNQKTYFVDGVGKNEGSISSNAFKDIHTGVYIDDYNEDFLGYLARYAGNPYLVLSNVFIANDCEIMCTVLNPTNSSQTIDANVGIYFTVVTSGNSGGSNIIDYSTTEQKTGQKWTNGSDIYQKTIVLNNYRMNPNTDQSITHGITDLGQIINYSFTCEITGESSYECGGLMTPWSAWADSTNFSFRCPSEWDGKTTRTWYITLQYTKTSN